MPKNSLILKLLLYSLLTLSFIFYPGHSPFLRTASLDYPAFEKRATLSFNPQPLPQVLTPFSFDLTSQSYLILDLKSFTPIVSYFPTRKMFPASLVKLATAMVSFEHYPLEKKIMVQKVINEELKMGLVRGERITVLNLLYGTLVYSANDAAYTLAENYPGGVKNFVRAMNKLAKDLNMNQTVFTNPIGFDNRQQHSTAFDLALLSREFVSNPLLLNMTSTKSITVSDVNFERFHYLSNINELLGEIPHLGGLKTGTTDNAGQNLISFYRIDNRPLLLVILKSEDRFLETRLLIDYLNQNLRFRHII